MPNKQNASSEAPSKLKVLSQSNYGTGKRKCAIARVWVFEGSGKVQVNGCDSEVYLQSKEVNLNLLKPLYILGIANKYDCRVEVQGGGVRGQLAAAQLGLARALFSMNPEFRHALKSAGLLTRDARIKERKKYGRKRARKGYQFRKR